MDATTPPAAPGTPRRLLRGCAVVLATGLLASCAGDDGEPAAAPTTVTATSGEASASATSEAATAQATTSEDGADGSGGDAAEDVVIVISDFSYEVPDAVAPGATVTVRNEDGVGHTVTSDDETTFDVQVGPGEEVTMTAPEQEGEFRFFCRPHPAMRGTLVVGEG